MVSLEEFEKARSNSDNQRIINLVCSKYVNKLSPEVLQQCGDYALWECLRSHDDSIQKFTSSLYRYVHWNCLRELENEYKYQNRHRVLVSDITQNEVGSYDISSYIAHLSELEQQVMIMKFVYSYSLRDIAKLIHYSKEWIRQIILKCLQKIKVEIQKDGV